MRWAQRWCPHRGGVSVLSATLVAMLGVVLVRSLVRWPGRALGVAGALVAWTVIGPWALWVVLGLVALATIGWRRLRRGRVWVPRYPLVRLVVAASTVVILTRGR